MKWPVNDSLAEASHRNWVGELAQSIDVSMIYRLICDLWRGEVDFGVVWQKE